MSIAVLVKCCKESDMLKAVHAVHPTVPATGWEMLDVLGDDLTKGRGNPYWKCRHEYEQLEQRVIELRRVSAAIQESEEKWVGCARAFVEQEMETCTKRLRQIEREVTPAHLVAFLTSKLGEDGPKGALIPGRGIEIVFADGMRLELVAQFYPDKYTSSPAHRECHQALRFAPYSAAITFLEHLPEQEGFGGTECEVLREGAGDVINYYDYAITSWATKASKCVAALKSRKGRAKAHRKLPAFNDEGHEIPA